METSSFVKALLSIDKVAEGSLFRYKSLAVEMNVSKSRISVLVDELEEEGYLLRAGAREVAILPKGKEAIASLKTAFDGVHRTYQTSLPLPEERIEELSLITLYQGSSSLLAALTGLAAVQ